MHWFIARNVNPDKWTKQGDRFDGIWDIGTFYQARQFTRNNENFQNMCGNIYARPVKQQIYVYEVGFVQNKFK